jgi:VanZ family protein
VNRQVQPPGAGKRAKAVCAVAVFAVLGATLWPFNPFPANGIRWLRGANGLKFERAGLVVGSEPLRPPETKSAESYTLELLLSPDNVKSARTILAFYAPTGPRQLLVRQWTDGLLVTHDVTVEHDKTKTIKFDVDHAFRPGRLVLVTISSGPNGTTVYLDGQSAESFPRFKIARTELSDEIVLGTSPGTYNPWRGEIRGLAVYSKQLTPEGAFRHYQEWTGPGEHRPDLDDAIARYAFTEVGGREVRNEVASGPNLEIPSTFSVPHKGFLLSPVKEFKADWNYAVDVGMNITGFVPLGLVVCSYLAWTKSPSKAMFYTVIACGILSFVIEVLQYYIPRRNSGTTDIITNTLGAALGAVLMRVSLVRLPLEKLKLIPVPSNPCRLKASASK